MSVPLFVAVVTFWPMLLEALLSRRNERALRAAGAIEPPGDVYAAMQVAYPASFLAMILEGVVRVPRFGRLFAAGLLVFVVGKALKYWAIEALGPRWSFRVLILRHEPLVTHGPYRWMRHPNYVGVAGELAGAALMAHAAVTGPVSMVIFGGLMLARIRVEERALEIRAR